MQFSQIFRIKTWFRGNHFLTPYNPWANTTRKLSWQNHYITESNFNPLHTPYWQSLNLSEGNATSGKSCGWKHWKAFTVPMSKIFKNWRRSCGGCLTVKNLVGRSNKKLRMCLTFLAFKKGSKHKLVVRRIPCWDRVYHLQFQHPLHSPLRLLPTKSN